MGQAIPSFRPGMGKIAFTKLQPSCQWFISVSPGRSKTDSERDIIVHQMQQAGSMFPVKDQLQQVTCHQVSLGPRHNTCKHVG